MILLDATTDKLKVVTSAAATIDVQANYVELSSSTFLITGGGNQNTAISTATTTDIVAAPGATTIRNVKGITIYNKDASLSCDVTVQYDANGTVTGIIKMTLLAGEMLEFIEGVGWFIVKPSVNATRTLTSVESDKEQRIFRTDLTRRMVVAAGTEDFILISGTAYYVYVGRVVQPITVKFVEFHITTAGAGTDTKEVGLFSTPSPPNKSAQTLTKIVATGTVDSGVSTGIKRNTSSFAQAVDAGTHLWAAMRCALGTTQPKMPGIGADYSQGHILTTTGGGALTGITTASGGLVAVALSSLGPDLTVTLD
jgi:hypothetical protein